MKNSNIALKLLLSAGLLAASAVQAQTPSPSAPPPAGNPSASAPAPRDRPMRPERAQRMQQNMERRAAELHDSLKLTPQQEPAWQAWVGAMKPQNMPPMQPPANAASMSAPERMEQHLTMMKSHEAQMQKRVDATKTFYNQLTPEQQKVFNEKTARGPWGGHEHGDHHGPGQREGRGRGQGGQGQGGQGQGGPMMGGPGAGQGAPGR